MSNPSKAKGSLWEKACVAALRLAHWPNAERRALCGVNDRGDIAGLPITIECKSGARIDLAGWIAELEVEMEHDGTETGFVWIKRRGKTSAMDGYIVTTPQIMLDLLYAAGY